MALVWQLRYQPLVGRVLFLMATYWKPPEPNSLLGDRHDGAVPNGCCDLAPNSHQQGCDFSSSHTLATNSNYRRTRCTGHRKQCMKIGVESTDHAVVGQRKLKNGLVACGGQSTLARMHDVPSGTE